MTRDNLSDQTRIEFRLEGLVCCRPQFEEGEEKGRVRGEGGIYRGGEARGKDVGLLPGVFTVKAVVWRR